ATQRRRLLSSPQGCLGWFVCVPSGKHPIAGLVRDDGFVFQVCGRPLQRGWYQPRISGTMSAVPDGTLVVARAAVGMASRMAIALSFGFMLIIAKSQGRGVGVPLVTTALLHSIGLVIFHA